MTAALVDHLWQSTWFAALAGLLTLVLRNNDARTRYWVWFAASLKFLVPFAWLTMLGGQFSWQVSATPLSPGSLIDIVQVAGSLSAPPQLVTRAYSLNLAGVLIAVWAAGSLALLARWLVSWLRVRDAVRKSVPCEIDAPLAVKASPALAEPGVVGVFRPLLLLPQGIAARLTHSQLQAILAHELCHVRRRDNLTAAIHMLVEILFWFHPLVWWIGARLVEERERACDEAVLESGNEPQAYAEGILKVCQFYLESKLQCVSGASGGDLRRRVQSIMRNRAADRLSAAAKVFLAATASAVIAVPVAAGVTIIPRMQDYQAAAAADLRFDTATIRPTPASHEGEAWLLANQGHLSVRGMPLRQLISLAYGVDRSQVIGGPDWLDSLRYDLDARSNGIPGDAYPGDLTAYSPMVRELLEQRFNLRIEAQNRKIRHR